MVDKDRYGIDIVTRISAVRAALRRVEEEVLKDHVAHCVEHAIARGDKAEQHKKIAEPVAVVGGPSDDSSGFRLGCFGTDHYASESKRSRSKAMAPECLSV